MDILVTRELDDSDMLDAYNLGLQPDCISYLKFEYEYDRNKLKKIMQSYDSPIWIFTSKKAVRSVTNMIENGIIDENYSECFAVGEKTAEKLRRNSIFAHYPEIYNADELADFIIENAQTKNAIYFKGNLSSPLLESKLTDNGFNVSSIEVYQTVQKKVDISKTYEAILFYSPSAVRSFNQNTGFEGIDSYIFAIGDKTKSELSKYTDKEILTPNIQTTEALIRFVYNTLKQNK